LELVDKLLELDDVLRKKEYNSEEERNHLVALYLQTFKEFKKYVPRKKYKTWYEMVSEITGLSEDEIEKL